MNPDSVHGLVDHLFRHQSANIKARLVQALGPAVLDQVEDAVQDALVAAVRRWPFDGIPDAPPAWLYQVARNRLIDRLRREGRSRSIEGDPTEAWPDLASVPPEPAYGDELIDDRLALLFTCCTPLLPRNQRVALTLKVACGFSIGEIAAAFLDRESTVAQRIVRSKRRLRESGFDPGRPSPEELPPRLDAVLEVIYLLFNEGYSAHDGDDLVRHQLCDEARRLVALLLERNDTDRPGTRALAALLDFQSARLPARVDASGISVPLRDQDRSQWDRRLVHSGFRHLARAEDPTGTPGLYHLEAAIAACHVAPTRYTDTDWRRILDFYDALLLLKPEPVVRLSRIIARAHVDGAAVALADLDAASETTEMPAFLCLTTRAELLEMAGHPARALDAWRLAAQQSMREPQRRHVDRRIDALYRQLSKN